MLGFFEKYDAEDKKYSAYEAGEFSRSTGLSNQPAATHISKGYRDPMACSTACSSQPVAAGTCLHVAVPKCVQHPLALTIAMCCPPDPSLQLPRRPTTRPS